MDAYHTELHRGDRLQAALLGIDRGDTSEVREYLDSMIRNEIHPSLLARAVHTENVEIMQLLLQHKADPNAKFNDYTMVTKACTVMNSEVLQTLLDFKADPNKCDDADEPPLLHAVMSNGSDISTPDGVVDCRLPKVLGLLRAGADPNRRVESATVFTMAMELASSSTSIIDAFLKHGADPSANYGGRPILAKMLETGIASEIRVGLSTDAEITEDAFAALRKCQDPARVVESKKLIRMAVLSDNLGVRRFHIRMDVPPTLQATCIKVLAQSDHMDAELGLVW
jgi:hypothetical protein